MYTCQYTLTYNKPFDMTPHGPMILNNRNRVGEWIMRRQSIIRSCRLTFIILGALSPASCWINGSLSLVY